MKSPKLLLMLSLTAGCATQVWHPTRTQAEQKRDIATCTEHAKLTEHLEPIGTLNEAYLCLEQKGYRRGPRPRSG